MRVLFLIGNGFDLHVGLETGYPEFLKYYLQQPLPDGVDELGGRFINRLKGSIKQDIDLWSSLELQYGKYMSNLGKMGSAEYTLQEEFDIINDDIREKLSSFIEKEDKRSFFSDDAINAFLEDIINPFQNLRDYEKIEISNRKSNTWNLTRNRIDFITFNYTRTIEHLLKKQSLHFSGYEINEPVHVHGYYNDRMILGVNDASQIDNASLRGSSYFTDALVKAECNHSYGISHTNQCRDLIYNSQLLCCYGLSFGDTDKLWWKMICDVLRQRSDLIVVLFKFVDSLPNYSNNGHKRQDYMRRVKDHFLLQGGAQEKEKSPLAQRIYVSLNDPIFNIHVDNRTPIERLIDTPESKF